MRLFHTPHKALSYELVDENLNCVYTYVFDGERFINKSYRSNCGGVNELKKLEEDSEITEDDLKGYQEDVQGLTDRFVKEIDNAVNAKEEDIMTV